MKAVVHTNCAPIGAEKHRINEAVVSEKKHPVDEDEHRINEAVVATRRPSYRRSGNQGIAGDESEYSEL